MKKKIILDIRRQNISIKKAGLLHMPRLMDIGPNTNTVITPIVQFITIPTEAFIFISKGAAGRLVHHCRTTSRWDWVNLSVWSWIPIDHTLTMASM